MGERMLIELDLLFAVFALLMVLPASILVILSNQAAFLSYSEAFSKVLVSDAGMQKLAFQMSGSDQPEDIISLVNGTGYSISQYNLSVPYSGANASTSRIAVANGMLYRLSVKK
jgi:hypothetical protein